MQWWVASAGFTLLAFACLRLAWCSCQPVIDEYHHLKCKRKRLCEGRHDEVPPAGALRDTLGVSSSLSFFPHPAPLFYFTAPLSIPLPFSPFYASFFSLPFLLVLKCLPCHLLFFSVPPTFVLLHSPPVSLLPPWFSLLSSLLYSGFLNWLLLCHPSVSDSFFLSLCLVLLHLLGLLPSVCLFA